MHFVELVGLKPQVDVEVLIEHEYYLSLSLFPNVKNPVQSVPVIELSAQLDPPVVNLQPI